MEGFGPLEAQYGAPGGPCWAVLSHLAIPKPHPGFTMGEKPSDLGRNGPEWSVRVAGCAPLCG